MEEQRNKIRLLLVDDHQIIMDGIRNMLRKTDDIWIVGEFMDGREALDFLAHNEVDLLITDLQMPKMSGIDLCKKVKASFPALKVLVLSMHHDPESVQQVFDVQAEGFLLKNTSRRELQEAIYRVIEGGTYYSREVLQTMLQKVMPAANTLVSHVELTTREREVLQLIAEEYTTAEIAKKLFISPRTVETYRKHLLQKTEARSVVGLIRFAIKHQLIQV
ncbi:MAG: response regulator transcription factor [Bacteroidota bacterium]